MDKQDLISKATEFLNNSTDNNVSASLAIDDSLVGMRIFDPPIFAFGDASDAFFTKLKDPAVIGDHFLLPQDWLAQAATVISFFLPFSAEVKQGNAQDKSWPSPQWLHGRIEGQVMVSALARFLQSELSNAGYPSVAPSLDTRFQSGGSSKDGKSTNFTSNWSERHVAFICGLGTFGLSKGLITKKGVAGRFGSIVTTLHLDPDVRDYQDIYGYCSNCGACIQQCPVAAISFEQGKNHQICSDFLTITASKFKPRYGCGKCQVNVPCEKGKPVPGTGYTE